MAGKRKSHTAAFKVQVALAAIKGDRTINELASHYSVHPTLIHARKRQLLAGAEAVFSRGAKPAGLEESLLQQYRELRTLEHQAFLIMGRFVLADVPPAPSS